MLAFSQGAPEDARPWGGDLGIDAHIPAKAHAEIHEDQLDVLFKALRSYIFDGEDFAMTTPQIVRLSDDRGGNLVGVRIEAKVFRLR